MRTRTAREIYLEAHGDAELLSHWYVRACQGMAEKDDDNEALRARVAESERALDEARAVCRHYRPLVLAHFDNCGEAPDMEESEWILRLRSAALAATQERDGNDGG